MDSLRKTNDKRLLRIGGEEGFTSFLMTVQGCRFRFEIILVVCCKCMAGRHLTKFTFVKHQVS